MNKKLEWIKKPHNLIRPSHRKVKMKLSQAKILKIRSQKTR